MNDIKINTLLIISIIFFVLGLIVVFLGILIKNSRKSKNDNSANFILRGLYIAIMGIFVFIIYLFG